MAGNALQKGMVWAGRPACLGVRFGARQAAVELVVDGAGALPEPDAARRMARRMLGLQQAVDDFEARYRGHPELGPLIAANPGLRVPLLATPFEATGLGRDRAADQPGRGHRGAPPADRGRRHPPLGRPVVPPRSRAAGANGGRAIARGRAVAGQGSHRDRAEPRRRRRHPAIRGLGRRTARREIRARLAAIRGIGPWTIEYTLLRGFGHLDGSLHGDVAVRRKLQLLLGGKEKISAAETERWLAQFTPWRALVAAHLWAWHP